MAISSDSIRLVAGLRAASAEQRDQVLEAVYLRYLVRMIGLLRKRLPAHLARRCDAEDLAQSAWASFVRGLDEQRFDLNERNSLWPLLARIALCKYHDLLADTHRQKRDVRREVGLDAAESDAPAHLSEPLEELAAAETVEEICSRLRDEKQQQVLGMHLDGWLVREISDVVGLSDRTVKRILSKIRNLYAEVVGLPSLLADSGSA